MLKKLDKTLFSRFLMPSSRRRAKKIGKMLSGKHGKILDFGCGNCKFETYIKNPHIKFYGIDVNEKNIAEAKKINPDVQVADGTKLPFKDNEFQGAITSQVIEYIEDDDAAIAEIARVVEKSGFCIISAPYKINLKGRAARWLAEKNEILMSERKGSMRRIGYSLDEINDKFRRKGFENVWHGFDLRGFGKFLDLLFFHMVYKEEFVQQSPGLWKPLRMLFARFLMLLGAGLFLLDGLSRGEGLTLFCEYRKVR